MITDQNKFLGRSLKLFSSLKRHPPCHSVYMFYANQQRIRARALTLTVDQTSHWYQCTAEYFLALLSFPPMKENDKKDLGKCRSERESVCNRDGERVQGDSVYCLWEVNDGAA